MKYQTQQQQLGTPVSPASERMTQDEVRAVLALWGREEALRAGTGPTFRDVAEALGTTPEEVQRVLEEARHQPQPEQHKRRSLSSGLLQAAKRMATVRSRRGALGAGAALAALAVAGIVVAVPAAHQGDPAAYSEQYQSNVADAMRPWLGAGVASEWPAWGRSDTMVVTRPAGIRGPARDLAYAVGRDFVRARERSGYGSAAVPCYVEVRTAAGPSGVEEGAFRLRRGANGALVAEAVSPSETPWNR
jgi:hypothetical protein